MLLSYHTYRFLLFPALLASLVLGSCCCHDSCCDSPAPHTDSITHVVTAYLVNEDLTAAMAVIDSSEAAGLLRPCDAEMLRLRVMSRDASRMLEAERANRRRDEIIAWGLAAIVLIVVVFTIMLLYQLQQIRRKNAVLSHEIAENIDYKGKYLRLKSHPEIDVNQKDKDSIPRLSTMNDTELFEFLRVVIVGEQLYLNPKFERQQLIDRFGLSKESIGAAFARGSRFASLPGYINECRLDYAAGLLSIRPELSMAEVATESGFANASVFTRNFKQRFALTPTEFRERHTKSPNI